MNMQSNHFMCRADIMPVISTFPNWDRQQIGSCQTNITLVGREKSKVMERLTYLIDGFEERMDYYVDFGDGHCRRILGRKFHYQFENPGVYLLRLMTREGDQMLPICSKCIEVHDISWKSILHSLNVF